MNFPIILSILRKVTKPHSLEISYKSFKNRNDSYAYGYTNENSKPSRTEKNKFFKRQLFKKATKLKYWKVNESKI